MAAVLMTGLSGCGKGGSGTDSSYIAKVNGEQISYSDYEKNYLIFKKQIEANVGQDIWSQSAGDGKTYGSVFKEQILEKLIEDELILKEAEKEEISVKEEELDKQLAEFKKQVEENKAYKEYLEKNNIGDDFVKHQMKVDSVIRDFRLAYEKKNPVLEEDMKKYYEEHLDEFHVNEVRASHILIATMDENRVPLSDTEKGEAKKKAEAALKRVRAGEDFAQLAKELSQDPGSAANGGDLGFFPKGQMVKAFEDAAFSMKPGEVSDLVESEYGYHIIKVVEKKDQTYSFDEVKDRISGVLMEESYQAYVQKLKDSAKIERNEKLLNEDAKQDAAAEEKKDEKK